MYTLRYIVIQQKNVQVQFELCSYDMCRNDVDCSAQQVITKNILLEADDDYYVDKYQGEHKELVDTQLLTNNLQTM